MLSTRPFAVLCLSLALLAGLWPVQAVAADTGPTAAPARPRVGLVLSGGCTGMSEAGPEEREAFRVSREVPLNAGQVPADFAPAVVKVIAGPDAPDAIRDELLASMSAIPAATYRDALVCFTSPRERFDFARLTMPTLLMTGQHDRLAPPSEIRAVAGRILDAAPQMQDARPDVQYETIPGVGHVCNVEGSDAYNAALIPVAAGVLVPFGGPQLSPMLGAGAMALSSVFVLTNALRLRRFRGVK